MRAIMPPPPPRKPVGGRTGAPGYSDTLGPFSGVYGDSGGFHWPRARVRYVPTVRQWFASCLSCPDWCALGDLGTAHYAATQHVAIWHRPAPPWPTC